MSRSVEFFDTQFKRQVQAGEFELNPGNLDYTILRPEHSRRISKGISSAASISSRGLPSASRTAKGKNA